MSIERDIRSFVQEEVHRVLAELLPEQGNDYLTTKQVADMAGLSTSFFEVGRSMSSPNQPPHRRVGRRILYRRADVEAWLAERVAS